MTKRMVKNPKSPKFYRRPGEATWPLDEDDNDWSGNIQWSEIIMGDVFDTINGTRTPKVWFIGGMSDLWHENSTMGMYSTMAANLKVETPHLLVFVTKRPQNLLDFQRAFFSDGLPRWVFAFLTVCTQEEADEKIPTFLQVKGRLGLHLEPLLGAVDLRYVWLDDGDALGTSLFSQGLGQGFEFIAAGAESGPGARPVDLDWLRSIRDQCSEAGVPFFLKRPLTLDGATHAPRLEMP